MATKRRKMCEGSQPLANGIIETENSLDFANFENWRPDDVSKYLIAKGFKNEAQLFQREAISGRVLGRLTEEHLHKKLKIRTLGRRLELLYEFEHLKNFRDNVKPKVIGDSLKVFNDPIHGHIDVHPLCVQLIDTQQFQRLRYIKQLGCSYLVFPGAAHNRFEHSLGVCHLAGMLCRTLQKRQPELNITEKDVLCVQIAGLCHDLGHGPFSHLFDGLFIPAVAPESKWTHERASVDMLDYLIKDNELRAAFAKYDLGDEDINFIKEQIAGSLERKSQKAWPYKGRLQDKSFLYEIVANKRNGIDVDKWDYFLRDCHNLGISSTFDCHRFMKFCRVIDVDGKKQICARDKEVGNLYDMFHTRNSLHRRAYQHKVNKIIETMLVEALVKANDHWLIKGKDGRLLKMSEAVDDMVAFSQLTDDIILQIMHSEDPSLAESQHILKSVQRRQLYKCIGQTQPPDGTFIARDEVPKMKEEIVGLQKEVPEGPNLTTHQLIIHVVDLNYGMGQLNPIDHVHFYSKDNPQQAVKIRKNEVSQMLPERFAEQHIRLYCKERDKAFVDKASKCFEIWCQRKKYTMPKAGNVLDPELTPAKPLSQDDNLETPEKKKSRTRLSM